MTMIQLLQAFQQRQESTIDNEEEEEIIRRLSQIQLPHEQQGNSYSYPYDPLSCSPTLFPDTENEEEGGEKEQGKTKQKEKQKKKQREKGKELQKQQREEGKDIARKITRRKEPEGRKDKRKDKRKGKRKEKRKGKGGGPCSEREKSCSSDDAEGDRILSDSSSSSSLEPSLPLCVLQDVGCDPCEMKDDESIAKEERHCNRPSMSRSTTPVQDNRDNCRVNPENGYDIRYIRHCWLDEPNRSFYSDFCVLDSCADLFFGPEDEREETRKDFDVFDFCLVEDDGEESTYFEDASTVYSNSTINSSPSRSLFCQGHSDSPRQPEKSYNTTQQQQEQQQEQRQVERQKQRQKERQKQQPQQQQQQNQEQKQRKKQQQQQQQQQQQKQHKQRHRQQQRHQQVLEKTSSSSEVNNSSNHHSQHHSPLRPTPSKWDRSVSKERNTDDEISQLTDDGPVSFTTGGNYRYKDADVMPTLYEYDSEPRAMFDPQKFSARLDDTYSMMTHPPKFSTIPSDTSSTTITTVSNPYYKFPIWEDTSTMAIMQGMPPSNHDEKTNDDREGSIGDSDDLPSSDYNNHTYEEEKTASLFSEEDNTEVFMQTFGDVTIFYDELESEWNIPRPPPVEDGYSSKDSTISDKKDDTSLQGNRNTNGIIVDTQHQAVSNSRNSSGGRGRVGRKRVFISPSSLLDDDTLGDKDDDNIRRREQSYFSDPNGMEEEKLSPSNTSMDSHFEASNKKMFHTTVPSTATTNSFLMNEHRAEF